MAAEAAAHAAQPSVGRPLQYAGGMLQAAARALRPGSPLLIVDRGSTAPWSRNQGPGARHPASAEIAAEPDLGPGQ